jgi:hypothetical protein
MSAPYLNRGESIILTTHRVSAGSMMYDALLTNERLILMDSRYTRFEPRMIHFPAIISVKGGKVPTGEPVIILTLDTPDAVSGSTQVDLIFTQQPGEQRKDERELWVRKIIELVISARERAMQTPVPLREKTGMHPTIRRWVAPEPARPHTSIQESNLQSRSVIATPDETNLPVFNREEVSPQEITSSHEESAEAPEEEPAPVTVTPTESRQDVPKPLPHSPEEDIRAETNVISGEESTSAPGKKSPDLLQAESAGITIMAEREGAPENQSDTSTSFAGTILSALQSLQSAGSETGSEVLDSPVPNGYVVGLPEEPGPQLHLPENDREPPGCHGIAADLDITETPARYDATGPHGKYDPRPCPAIGKEPAETQAVPAQDTPVPASMQASQEPLLPVMQPDSPKSAMPPARKKTVITAIILVLIAMLVLSGGIILFSHYLQKGEKSIPTVIAPQTPTPPQTLAPVPSVTPPRGIRIDVIYPGVFAGSIGNPGSLHRVSGTGNRTFGVLMTTDIIQATIQKQDNSGEPLTVAMYDNSTLLAHKTVTAPGGEINLLIDTKTSSPPGIVPDTLPGVNSTLTGNGTLVYF